MGKFPFGSVWFTVKSLTAQRAVEKLVREGIPVLGARELEKNVLELNIRAKDMKKAFAILQSSWYNIENVRFAGTARLARQALSAAGLLIGILLFSAFTGFAETRVLKLEVTGSGAYYEREVLAILREEGVKPLSAMPGDTGGCIARILALPRVEFCSFKRSGGILTVEVHCAENIAPLSGMPLTSPVGGTVEELIVVRGTPLVQVGDEVHAGDVVIADYTLRGEEKIPAIVIGSVTVKSEFSVEYELAEEEAIARAMLEFGEISEIHIAKTERGCLVEGVAYATASINLD